MENDVIITRLVAVSVDRQASELDEVRWTYRHMLVPWEDICPETVPSPGALGLLAYAKRAENQKDFYTLWAKLLPRRSEMINGREPFFDDNRRLDEIDFQSAMGPNLPYPA